MICFSHSARYQDVTGRIICLCGFKIYNLTFRIYKLLGDGGKNGFSVAKLTDYYYLCSRTDKLELVP